MGVRLVWRTRPDDLGMFAVWQINYIAPWLFLLHVAEVTVLIVFIALYVLPTTRITFLMRQALIDTLALDRDGFDVSVTQIEDLQAYLDGFNSSVDNFVRGGFSNASLWRPDSPVEYELSWANGTRDMSTTPPSLDAGLFAGIEELSVATSLRYVRVRGAFPGCTRWNFCTVVSRARGSWAFSARYVVGRHDCETATRAAWRSSFGADAICLLVLSFLGLVVIVTDFRRRLHRHRASLSGDAAYRDLSLYEQFHTSFGFWLPIHAISEATVVGLAAKLVADSFTVTQLMPRSALRFVGVGAFMSMMTASRWFSFSAKTYELVLVVRVAFGRLVSIVAGLWPWVAGCMMIGMFVFGLVSDISRSYWRFVQLFLGLVFGDDMYGVYDYYTDGSSLFTVLAFLFCSALGVLAGYFWFPAFTATIVLLRDKFVSPIMRGEGRSESES